MSYRSTLMSVTCATCYGFAPYLAIYQAVGSTLEPGTARPLLEDTAKAVKLPDGKSQLVQLNVWKIAQATVAVEPQIEPQVQIADSSAQTPSQLSAASESNSGESPNPTPRVKANRTAKTKWLLWSLVVLGVSVAAGFLLRSLQHSSSQAPKKKLAVRSSKAESFGQIAEARPSNPALNPLDENGGDRNILSPEPLDSINSAELATIPQAQSSAVTETTRLPKVNISEELVKDLHSLDPAKRRKAIWDLGQRGDSQAVQPLVDLMIDSDSSQRNLILAAVSEIGIRTLKPMSRALLISLQDENADVRKNAIRDVTRIYDLVAQISQILSHAVNDPDVEVQETAQWALGQLNRIRAVPEAENGARLLNSENSPERLSSDPPTSSNQ